MRTILCGVNARFSHMNLAIRYLEGACRGICETTVKEYTINDPVQHIIWDLTACGGDVYCFSSYIWNIDILLRAAEGVKKAISSSIILFGGPEASYSADELLQEQPFIDHVLSGEGEKSLPAFIRALQGTGDIQSAPNLYYRREGKTAFTHEAEPNDMDSLPDAYTTLEEGRMIYYESSRGCPYHCTFCLSSRSEKPRYRSLEKTFADLSRFISAGAKQVKFVDRTFNADKDRAYAIFNWLIEKGRNMRAGTHALTNFHFEIAGHLLDDDTLTLLEKAPKGLFQFEMGVQSLNEETLHAISRKQDFGRIEHAVSRLKRSGNIHVHLDLIAGLPCETEESFKATFERVFALQPDTLQLGFLKLLKGSRLREEAEKYGIQYGSFAPYEVISTPGLPVPTMQKIRRVCSALDMLYNKGGLQAAIHYMAEKENSAFLFLLQFAAYADSIGIQMHGQGREGAAKALLEYAEAAYPGDEACRDLIRYAYFKGAGRRTMQTSLGDGFDAEERETVYKALARLHPGMAWKQILVCGFNTDVMGYEEGKGVKYERTYVLFDYATGETTKLIIGN